MEVEGPPMSRPAPKRKAKKERQERVPEVDESQPADVQALRTICMCGSGKAIGSCECPQAGSYRTLNEWLYPFSGDSPPKKRRTDQEFLQIAKGAWDMIDYLNG